MVNLTEQERMALCQYLGANWAEFSCVASDYLSDEEIEELGEKLEQQS